MNSIHRYNIIQKYYERTFRKRGEKPKQLDKQSYPFPETFQVWLFLRTYKVNYKDRVNTKPKVFYTNYTWDLDRHGCQVTAFFLPVGAFNYTICWLHGHWVSGMGFIVSIPTLVVFASAEWREGLGCKIGNCDTSLVRQPPLISQSSNSSTSAASTKWK